MDMDKVLDKFENCPDRVIYSYNLLIPENAYFNLVINITPSVFIRSF